MRPLSNLARRTAQRAIDRTAAEASAMPGHLLPPDRLEELTSAARCIVTEVGRLPEAPYDLFAPADQPIDDTVAGLLVGRRLGMQGDDLLRLGLGLFLKDIGKLALPPAIVHKESLLDDAESEVMRRHPQRGLELLHNVDLGRDACAAIRFHHERWDGAGYPSGLAGERIPLSARIAAVAGGFVTASGLEALRAGSGSAFDPKLVEVLEDIAMARSPGLRAVAA